MKGDLPPRYTGAKSTPCLRYVASSFLGVPPAEIYIKDEYFL
jgi:hypothetical protein